MRTILCHDAVDLACRAVDDGAAQIRRAIDERGEANLIFATGASQARTLAALVAADGIDWTRVTGFHLDEYVGLPVSHRASFRRYLKERLVGLLPFRAFHFLDGEADPCGECRRVGAIIARHPIDVAWVGIGENGHLAFNDPPADFQTEEPYLVVQLDAACRAQQTGEGWFPTVDDVPRRAISMSIRQIMKSQSIICCVPDGRKAEAVRRALEGPVTPAVPASILQQHDEAVIYLDPPAADRLHDRHLVSHPQHDAIAPQGTAKKKPVQQKAV